MSDPLFWQNHTSSTHSAGTEQTPTHSHVMNVHTHVHTQKQTPPFEHFSYVDIYSRCSWTLWGVIGASVYLGASPEPAGGGGGGGGFGGGWGPSVVARAHVNITFHQRWPRSSILNASKPSRDANEYPACLWHHGVSTAAPVSPQHSSFDISHRWLTRRGSPPHHPSWP